MSQPLRPACEASEPRAVNTPLIIVGAGLAGCWLARLLAEDGIACRLLDQSHGTGTGASGNPAGIAKPYVTRTPSQAMAFHVAAYQFLQSRLRSLQLDQSCRFTDCGVLQLVRQAYPASDYFTNLDTEATRLRAGISLNSASLHFPEAGWLDPRALCHSLVKHPLITQSANCKLMALQSSDTGSHEWRIETSDGKTLTAQHVVLALGHRLCSLPWTARLPLIPARGQLSRFAVLGHSDLPACVIAGKHYVIPDGQTIIVGASFDRGNADSSIRQDDHASNLDGLRKTLPTIDIDPKPIGGHAGVRATTPDRLPMVGPAPDFDQMIGCYRDLQHGKPPSQYPPLPGLQGLHVLGGFGSRGIVTAPYCAYLLANWLQGRTSDRNPHSRLSGFPGIRDLQGCAPLLNPARFIIRDLQRGRNRA